MALAFEKKLSAPPDLLANEIDGQSVMLNLKDERYYGLDEVGCRMWNVLTTSASIQSAYEALLTEFEVEPEKMRQDLEVFIGEMLEYGLVQVAD